jgi:nitroimidazol reductase NimA-like FMN-containing flavoprotein (pyridoxamine 5'-phosphate oxidase superfamily)
VRRKDREVTDPGKIQAIIQDCHCCRLGLQDGNRIYIVPLNFGYEEKQGKRLFYFHGAKEGRKMDLIAKNPNVGFELDTHYRLKEGASACEYSAYFQSVVGSGRIAFLADIEDKKHALQAIMRQGTGKEQWLFSEAMLRAVCVFQLEVEELSCKEHVPDRHGWGL